MKHLLGLSVAVEVDGDGFRPVSFGGDNHQFGWLRWRGFAAAVRSGFVEQVTVVGGEEFILTAALPESFMVEQDKLKSSGDSVLVPRGLATIHALETMYGIDRDQLSYEASVGNTEGNARRIAELYPTAADRAGKMISSNYFHLVRAAYDLVQAGVNDIPVVPTESFLVAETEIGSAERAAVVAELRGVFGESNLTEVALKAIVGIAAKLRGEYRSVIDS